MSDLRRREVITLLGGAATAGPLAAGAQQSAMPVVGFLHGGSPDLFANLVRAFRQGLQETGYVEGQNLAIEYRWAEGDNDKLPALAADLVHHRVRLIGAPISASAAPPQPPPHPPLPHWGLRRRPQPPPSSSS